MPSPTRGRDRAVPAPRGPVATLLAFGLLALALVVGACAGAPAASFDPASACTGPADEGTIAGAYPDLEAALPTSYEGRAPNRLDSGRSCTSASLGTLADDGVAVLRFAGALWDDGGGRGFTVAVFEGDGLTADAMRRFYQAPAEASSRTERLRASDITVDGRPGRRLDVLGSSGQATTIVAWPDTEPDRVRVLLAADVGDRQVEVLLDWLANG